MAFFELNENIGFFISESIKKTGSIITLPNKNKGLNCLFIQ